MRRDFLLVLVLALSSSAAAAPAEDQEIGARLGPRLNLAGLGAGGVELAGTFLYRVSQAIWIDSRAQVAIGGRGGGSCHPSGVHGTACDSAVLQGRLIGLLVGPRLFLDDVGAWTPHVGGGAGIGYVVVPADDLGGIALPLWLGGGARTAVRPGLALGVDAVLSIGPARFDRDQGWRPFVALSVLASLDFGL